jgi:AraC-like DNA-binding protein
MDKSALKERVQHGTEAFPFQAYPGFLNPLSNFRPQDGFSSHWHEEMEMIWVPDAAAGTLTVDGSSLAAKPKSIFFIHPGEIHSWESKGAKASGATALVFHWRLLDLLSGSAKDLYLQPLSQGRLKLPRMITAAPGWKQEIYDELGMLVAEASAMKAGSELVVLGRLYLILSKLAGAGVLKAADPRQTDRSTLKAARIKKALQYILDHPTEKITVAELAGAAGLSPFHFCRQFKVVTNQTPVNYLNRFRVERAAEILRDPNRKVLDASLDVGFTHLSYFIKIFKRFQHCTPSEYRAAYLAGGLKPSRKKSPALEA